MVQSTTQLYGTSCSAGRLINAVRNTCTGDISFFHNHNSNIIYVKKQNVERPNFKCLYSAVKLRLTAEIDTGVTQT